MFTQIGHKEIKAIKMYKTISEISKLAQDDIGASSICPSKLFCRSLNGWKPAVVLLLLVSLSWGIGTINSFGSELAGIEELYNSDNV